jgi:hypothetical protein
LENGEGIGEEDKDCKNREGFLGSTSVELQVKEMFNKYLATRSSKDQQPSSRYSECMWYCGMCVAEFLNRSTIDILSQMPLLWAYPNHCWLLEAFLPSTHSNTHASLPVATTKNFSRYFLILPEGKIVPV